MSTNEKVAILLHALGGESIDSALQLLNEDRRREIMARLETFEQEPTDIRTVEDVLGDFEKFFKFAIEAANADSYWDQYVAKLESKSEGTELAQGSKDEPESVLEMPEVDAKKTFPKLDLSDDPFEDLRKLAPRQIVEALKTERAKTVALVLGCLSDDATAKVIELLPEALQTELVPTMVDAPEANPTLLRQLVQSAVEKASKVESIEEEALSPDQRFAQVLRQMDRDTRARMLSHLAASDEEKAASIRQYLYVFEDVVKYDDRSIQKILAEVDKSHLMIALQNADEAITTKIMSNLSKRARTAFEEEMEFLPKQTTEDVDNAIAEIVNVIANLDQENQLQEVE